MLFCSVKTTVETGPALATLLDSKVSGFDCPHVKRYRIQKFPLWRADSKLSGFAGRIHRMRADERRVRKEKFADSKASGYKWTGLPTALCSTTSPAWHRHSAGSLEIQYYIRVLKIFELLCTAGRHACYILEWTRYFIARLREHLKPDMAFCAPTQFRFMSKLKNVLRPSITDCH